MKNLFTLSLLTVAMSGCMSVSPEARSIMVHRQYSTLLDNCQNMGPVQVDATNVWAKEFAASDAIIKLREKVHAMGGDTLALVNSETYIMAATAQGIAFKCSQQPS